MQERTSLEDQLNSIARLTQELDDQIMLIELGEAEKDTAVVADAETALKALRKERVKARAKGRESRPCRRGRTGRQQQEGR